MRELFLLITRERRARPNSRGCLLKPRRRFHPPHTRPMPIALRSLPDGECSDAPGRRLALHSTSLDDSLAKSSVTLAARFEELLRDYFAIFETRGSYPLASAKLEFSSRRARPANSGLFRLAGRPDRHTSVDSRAKKSEPLASP